jgi:hypothetical protein
MGCGFDAASDRFWFFSTSFFGDAMKHKHYDMIVAWANGAKIQARLNGDGWHDLTSPSWNGKNFEYRIKPEPNPDLIKYMVTNSEDLCRWVSVTNAHANLRLTFDGETGVLKLAEVI